MPRSSRQAMVLSAVLVALLYFLAARLSLVFVVQPVAIATIWPPSGLLFAVLVLSARHTWPLTLGMVLLAIIGANLTAGNTLLMSLGFAGANCIESLAMAWLFLRLVEPPVTLTNLRQVLVLTGGVVVLGNALTAVLGAAIASLGVGAPFLDAWITWWTADGLGMLLVGSTILAWSQTRRSDFSSLTWWQLAEMACALGALLVVTFVIFDQPPDQASIASPYLVFPFLLWVSVRFGSRGATVGAFLLAVQAIWYTLHKRGPFVALSGESSIYVLEVQAFLLVEVLTALVLAALMSERQRAQATLQQTNDALEQQVMRRTAALRAINRRLEQEIDERTRTEQALRQSEERLSQALRVGHIFAFEWDFITNRIIRSTEGDVILGLQNSQGTSDTTSAFFGRIHPDDRDQLAAYISRLTPDTDTYRVMYRVLHGDGTVITLEETARGLFDQDQRLVRLFGITADVTARVRTEAQQRFLDTVSRTLVSSLEYEATLATVVRLALPYLADYSAVHLLSEDQQALTFTAAHRVAAKHEWLTEQVGMHCVPLDWFPAPLTQALLAGEALLLSDRNEAGPEFVAQQPLHELSQKLGLCSFLMVPLYARGQLMGGLVLAISESKRRYNTTDVTLAEELARRCALALDNARLYEAEQQARQSAEAALQVREQFLSVASHELKTPLTALTGSAQLLKRRLSNSDGANERDLRTVHTIVAQADRLNRLIASLLDVSRFQFGQSRIHSIPLDIVMLVERVLEEIHPIIAQHQLVYTEPRIPLLVLGDSLRLEQVVYNLVQNAIKYSPAGGTIHVELGQHNGYAVLRVADQGIGIPSTDLPQLFHRFFRASNVNHQQISGMGIGLSLVHEIVRLHGGDVTVESTEGAGSTFTVTLPLVE